MTAARFHSLAPQLRDLVAPRDRQAADRELLLRFSAEGDEDAFAEIVRRHGPMLLRVCRRISPNGHDAEDISQAAFLLLARKAASGGWHDSVAGWLYQTAYRLARKARVAAGRRARREALVRSADPPDPTEELTVRELQEALDEELSQLPEKYRAPIVLCCLEGRSRDEAAGYLGWPLGAVKDGLERGRERLRARLARRGVVLGTALTSAWLLEGAALAAMGPHATARAALLLASGQATLAGLLPAPVAALTKGVTTTMLVCRMTILASALALAFGAASGLSRPKDAPPGRPARPPEAKPAPDDTGPVRPEAMFLTGYRGAANAVAFAPDGKLAAAGADGTVRVWDVSSGAQLQKLDQGGNAAAVAFSPDGRTLVAATAGKAGTLTTWDAATGRALWRVPGGVAAVAFSPDGKRLAAATDSGSTPPADTAGSLDVATGRMYFLFHAQGKGTALAFSPDGKQLVVADSGGNLYLLDGASGRNLRGWRPKGAKPPTAVAFFAGGRKVAAADGGKAVRVLDPATGKEEVAFEAKEAARALAVSPDGRRVVTAGADGAILLWDAAGKAERRFPAGGAVNGVAFSPDGRRVATAGANGVVVWDLTRDEKPLPKDFQLAEKDLPALWTDLASDDGGKAYQAARRLRADPARALPFLAGRLRPKDTRPDQQKLKQLISGLDSDEFGKREAATRELEKAGRAAETALRDALAAGPSLEAKRRLEQLLRRLGGEGQALTPEQQRDVRAVRVLEQAGTPEARKLLEALVKASSGWWITQEAKEALGRLSPREKQP